jgi:hypothetical protein
MLRKVALIGAVLAASLAPLPAPADSALRTNPGAKYVPYGNVGKFHTNPGGKYVYPGYSAAPR